MKENIDCYTFKKIIFSDGIFNDSIDATYIIHLEGNGRLKSIEDQLTNYHPTNSVYILFNKGYKKCTKTLVKQNSEQDLNDAFLQIFKDANTKEYSNILILEDDFIFSPEIKNITNINNINTFLINNKDTSFNYQLGTVPLISFLYNSYTYRTISMGMHASVYSKLYRNNVLKMDFQNPNNIYDWD